MGTPLGAHACLGTEPDSMPKSPGDELMTRGCQIPQRLMGIPKQKMHANFQISFSRFLNARNRFKVLKILFDILC